MVYYVAMLWYAMVNENQMMCCEIHCYAIVKYSNAMIRLIDLYALLCRMLLKICLNWLKWNECFWQLKQNIWNMNYEQKSIIVCKPHSFSKMLFALTLLNNNVFGSHHNFKNYVLNRDKKLPIMRHYPSNALTNLNRLKKFQVRDNEDQSRGGRLLSMIYAN